MEQVPMLDSIAGMSSKAIGLLLAFLAPIKTVMFAVGFLVIMDLLTGIWAAKKRGEKITSNGLRNTVSKTLAYVSCILVSHVAEMYLVPDLPMVKVVAALIGMTEVKSFFENMNHITGIDIWDHMLSKMHGNRKLLKKKSKKK